MDFSAIDSDLFCLCTSFLVCSDIISLSITSHSLAALCADENIWKSIFVREIGNDVPIAPPACLLPSFLPPPPLHSSSTGTAQAAASSSSSDSPQETPVASFKQAVIAWRHHFREFSFKEVKMANMWWKRMKAWLLRYAPAIHSTLNPGLHPHVICALESDHSCEVPRLMKLLYMFHNGQTLLFEQPNPLKSEILLRKSLFNGLFGGLQYYDVFINMRMLSLENALPYVRETNIRRAQFMLKPTDDLPLRRVDCSMARPWVFAANVPLRGAADKLFVYVDKCGDRDPHDQVFTNFGIPLYVYAILYHI